MEFTPSHSVPSFLAFLGAGVALFAAAVALVLALLARKYEFARAVLLGTLVAVGVYLAVLVAVSLASRERVLALGEQKYFCEVDCHLAYSVQDVTVTKTLGVPPHEQTAAGSFYVVTVKVWFDQRTISPGRGNTPLRPHHRRVAVLDDAGRKYAVSVAAQMALEQAVSNESCLCESLRPGESRTTRLVFDLPTDAGNPRLLVTTAEELMTLVIGHENSFFHKRISFLLEPRPGDGKEISSGLARTSPRTAQGGRSTPSPSGLGGSAGPVVARAARPS